MIGTGGGGASCIMQQAVSSQVDLLSKVMHWQIVYRALRAKYQQQNINQCVVDTVELLGVGFVTGSLNHEIT